MAALGGGGFINDNIRKEVLSNHISFWLDWDESILLQRIRNSKKRPLVFKSTDKEIREIENLFRGIKGRQAANSFG